VEWSKAVAGMVATHADSTAPLVQDAAKWRYLREWGVGAKKLRRPHGARICNIDIFKPSHQGSLK